MRTELSFVAAAVRVCTLRILLILALMITAGAASAPAQRSCGPASLPKDLPAVHEIIDSGGALLELRQANALRDSMQLTLLVLAGDSIPVFQPIDSTDGLAAAVLARVAWPQTPGDLWAVRVHVTGGSAAALTISRAVYCPPVLAPASGPPVEMMPVLRERVVTVPSGSPGYAPSLFPRVRGTPPVPAVFEVEINPMGAVDSVKMVRSSGSDVFDKYVREHLARQMYEPALLDGIPVPAVIRAGKNVTDRPLPPGP